MKTEELIALKAAFEDRPMVQHGGLVCGRAEEQAMLALNYMDRMVLALHERDRALEECRGRVERLYKLEAEVLALGEDRDSWRRIAKGFGVEASRLREIIKSAPHAKKCGVHWHLGHDKYAPCNCWKRQALSESSDMEDG